MSKEEIEIRTEERRALVLLGLLAFLAALWDKLPSDATFNFPANSPFPHVTVNASPLLLILMELWVGYGICMFFYFSDDWFRGKPLWTDFRELCRGLGLTLIGLLLVIFYTFVMAEISFFLPDVVQGGYWFFVVLTMFVIVSLIGDSAFRQKGTLRRAIKEWFHSIVELSREVKSALSKRLGRRRKSR